MNEPTKPTPVEPPQRGQQPLASFLERRIASRLRARRVRRLVRHIEPWSVLKMSLIFYFCLWVILLIAGVILWRFAVTSGTVEKVESFIEELFALETFTFNPDQIFRVSALGGLVMVVAGSGFTVLMAVLFNLISDLVGGVRMTVVERRNRPAPPQAHATPRRTARCYQACFQADTRTRGGSFQADTRTRPSERTQSRPSRRSAVLAQRQTQKPKTGFYVETGV